MPKKREKKRKTGRGSEEAGGGTGRRESGSTKTAEAE